MTRLTTLLLLVLVACSKTPEPEKAPEPTANANKPATSTSAAVAKPTAGGEITYTVPPAWISAPNPNAMRKATYKVQRIGNDPEDAELSVSTASGGVDANIQRWAGQFGNATPAKEQRSPNGLKVTVVHISGTFTNGMAPTAGGPRDHWALLGAVVDQGDTLTFFKLTGPEQTVNATTKDFDAFVASFQAK